MIGARRDEGASRDDVTEKQQRPGPKMGLPVGPGCFWAAPASLIAFILPVCALIAPWLAPKLSRPIVTGYFLTDPKTYAAQTNKGGRQSVAHL